MECRHCTGSGQDKKAVGLQLIMMSHTVYTDGVLASHSTSCWESGGPIQCDVQVITTAMSTYTYIASR